MNLTILQACNAAALGKQQWRVMGAILEKTIGYNKWSDDISLSQLSQISRIRRDKVYTVLKSLKAHGLIITERGKYGRIVTIHPDLQEQAPKCEKSSNESSKKTRPKEPETGVDLAPKQVQIQTQKRSTTLITTDKTTTDVVGGVDASSEKALRYPDTLSVNDQQEAQEKLSGIHSNDAQTILDLWRHALSNQIIRKPLGYLMGIIKNYRAGDLNTECLQTYQPSFGIKPQGAEDTPAARAAHDRRLAELLGERGLVIA